MRAEWKDNDRGGSLLKLDSNLCAYIEQISDVRYRWEALGVESAGYGKDLPAAKLAAEREIRRLIGEAAEAMGGTVNWNAATPQEGK